MEENQWLAIISQAVTKLSADVAKLSVLVPLFVSRTDLFIEVIESANTYQFIKDKLKRWFSYFLQVIDECTVLTVGDIYTRTR